MFLSNTKHSIEYRIFKIRLKIFRIHFLGTLILSLELSNWRFRPRTPAPARNISTANITVNYFDATKEVCKCNTI